jgi:hypothetical protein
VRQRLKVTPIEGEIFRFHVSSQREGIPPYLVDLQAVGGLAFCGCLHYDNRIYNLLKNQLHLPWQERRYIDCIHVLAAREYFCMEIIHHLSERLTGDPNKKIVIGGEEPPKEDKQSWKDFWFQRFFHWKSPDENK